MLIRGIILAAIVTCNFVLAMDGPLAVNNNVEKCVLTDRLEADNNYIWYYINLLGVDRKRCPYTKDTYVFLQKRSTGIVCDDVGESGVISMKLDNLLVNPTFEFHSFDNHRNGNAVSYMSHNVAYWNTQAWGDISVMRESHVSADIRPDYTVHNIVSIEPGKKFWQFFTLPEAGLSHDDFINLIAAGYQHEPNAIKMNINLMKLDSEDGTWCPADFGMEDNRIFSKHARGELVIAKQYSASSSDKGRTILKIKDAKIIGHFIEDELSHSANINTIGIVVEFENTSAKEVVYVYSPCLYKSKKDFSSNDVKRQMVPYYHYIPRTIQKLWKGQSIHIIMMGSSIDRGSANPPMVPFDEDINSPLFKRPLIPTLDFKAGIVQRPDLEGYVGQWRHYYSAAGRLKLELMRKFNLPANKVCLNFMARDGSCVAEAAFGLQEYCSLSLPPDPELNGHKSGYTWKELYPDLFTRPQGTVPDLIIFGSGANEKTDTPDEVAIFEGTIRWIQQHYPSAEFLFCPFQNNGKHMPNDGDLQALALAYQIPFIDFGKISDDLGRWHSPYSLVPGDGHPQAACHYIWFKQLEKAFECWDPIEPGQTQLRLPQRVHENSFGWEGHVVSYDANCSRINNGKFIFDDTVINCWGNCDSDLISNYVDGQFIALRKPFPTRDIRNSLFAYGRSRLGDRHILEIKGRNAKLTAVDTKVCTNRQFYDVGNKLWKINKLKILKFDSRWGNPYGNKQIVLKPNEKIEIELVCTDVSIAYADVPDGGLMKVFIDDEERLSQKTDLPFIDIENHEHYMENRKGILALPYGIHKIEIKAFDSNVSLLGIFTYDSRPNREFERKIIGIASSNELVKFIPSFKARPIVICSEGLKINNDDIKTDCIKFRGDGIGIYEIIGE